MAIGASIATNNLDGHTKNTVPQIAKSASISVQKSADQNQSPRSLGAYESPRAKLANFDSCKPSEIRNSNPSWNEPIDLSPDEKLQLDTSNHEMTPREHSTYSLQSISRQGAKEGEIQQREKNRILFAYQQLAYEQNRPKAFTTSDLCPEQSDNFVTRGVDHESHQDSHQQNCQKEQQSAKRRIVPLRIETTRGQKKAGNTAKGVVSQTEERYFQKADMSPVKRQRLDLSTLPQGTRQEIVKDCAVLTSDTAIDDGKGDENREIVQRKLDSQLGLNSNDQTLEANPSFGGKYFRISPADIA